MPQDIFQLGLIMKEAIDWYQLNALYLILENSEFMRDLIEASQKMLLPLKAVLSKRKGNKDYRG